MADSMRDRVVVITGASSGIGAAAARLLAASGCRLVLGARSESKLQLLAEELGPETIAVPTDVTRQADIDNLVSATMKQFGRIDALLANAGIYFPGEVIDGDPDEWANLLDVNVNGVFRTTRAVLPIMRKQRRGDVLVTSSISGHVDLHWEPIYSASKHAIQTFVHTLRRQVLGDNIRIMAVAPGKVANELWGFTEQSAIDKEVAEHASIRSEDVAEVIAFMLSRPEHVTIRDLVILPQAQDL